MFDGTGDNSFDDIFCGLFNTATYENNLNKLFCECKVNDYYKYLNEIKSMGYKVFRNSNGNHKVRRI